ncbi:MAG: DNA ligase D, partial [Gemmatimonadota bacterium]
MILWDHGTYVPIHPSADATDGELEEGLRDGKVEFELFGERMKGKWGLIRIRGSAPGDAAGKAPWLLIKKKDEHASAARDLVSEYHTSVVSGLTFREVDEAGVKGERVRARGPGAVAAEAPDFQPMLAERSEQLPGGTGWVLEEKVDGVRVIVRAGPEDVRLLSRTGQRLEPAFPEVAEAVRRVAERSGASFVLDAELAVRDAQGRARFEEIQPRINLKSPAEIQGWARRRPAELFAFDCLWANGLYFADRPLTERKVALRELLRFAEDGVHELPWWDADAESDDVWRRAQVERWEGLMAKRRDSRYLSGRRSREWVKVKLVNQEEFVVVGWTDPEGGRSGFGALLLGYHDETGDLRYAGRAGTGFSTADLEAIAGELRPLERETSPCVDPPGEAGLHWVAPRLVAAVKFQEWTRDRRLRAPVFLGLRRDKPAERVRITEREIAGAAADLGPAATSELDALHADLERAEATGKDLRATVDGVELTFTNLAKVLWPEDGVTKGDLLRYYARVSPWLCPALADRPLHLERYPDGIDGERFWQQRAPSPAPQGIPTVAMEDDGEVVERLVGGSPATLLYTTQLAAIPQHPWPSRVDSLESMDYAILDLDPGPEVTFERVRDVARWAREELDGLDLLAFLKTSGGRGLHIV